MNSKILLNRPALKDFKINICNDDDLWEFEYKPKMMEITPLQLAREIILKTQMFEIHTIFQPELDDNSWKSSSNNPENLSGVPKQLLQKYCDFFNMIKAVHPPY